METNRIRKTVAILLAVLFLVTVTVGAVGASTSTSKNPKNTYSQQVSDVKLTDKSTGTPTSYKWDAKENKDLFKKDKDSDKKIDDDSTASGATATVLSNDPAKFAAASRVIVG